MDDKLKTASENYRLGCTCSQAVFCAYAKELGLEEEKAYRLMEGFGEGCGGMQEVCGALSASTAIISFYCSAGNPDDGNSKELTFQKIHQAEEMFKKEYGGLTCREILHGQCPKQFQCGMKVKDAILIIEFVLGDVKAERKENHEI
ncbi:MAG: C_GCAxxG_C_C family protein [Clostridia bacterium]|nr:C_GCAxxG_C_C family protein [Clostridia bacterium]